MWGTSGGIMLLGAIPALLVGVVYVAAGIALVTQLDPAVGAITAFADGWPEWGRTSVRVGVGVALVVGVILLLVYSYAAVVLAVGEPFYEKIWRRVENRLGDAPTPPAETVMAGLGRGILNGLRLLVPAIGMAIVFLLLSLIPVIGPIAASVLGALWGGWSLTVQLTGYAFDGRGRTLSDRLIALRSRRARSFGFGIATYVLLLVPGLAIFLMPSAVAGATALARDTLTSDSLSRPITQT
jgi:CysZ protein